MGFVVTAVQTPDRRGGYYHLLKAVFLRELLIWVRYPLDAVLGIITKTVFFGLLIFGGSVVAPNAVSNSLGGIIIGIFLLSLTSSAYSGITGAVGAEATWGTLERHYLTPFGFGPVMLAKGIGIMCKSFIKSLLVFLLLLAFSGKTLKIPLLTVIIVTFLSITSVLGVGFVTGGLGILYKKIGAVNNLISFIFLGLISAPVFDLWWAKLLPLAQGSALLQRTMKDGVRIWEFDPTSVTILFGVAVFYLVIGYVMFGRITRRARKLGTLGDY